MKRVLLYPGLVRGFLGGLGGYVLGIGSVMGVRPLIGLGPGEPGLVITLALVPGLVGYLLGLGALDYWLGWVGGRADAEGEDAHEAPSSGWARYFVFNTDHKVIGLQYLITALLFFLIGGGLAETFRLELAAPGLQFLSLTTYNEFISAHGIIMLLLFIIPSLTGGMGNYLVPLMIGARDMAFPRLNALSYWLYLFGGLFLLLGLVAGGFGAGWTAYPPLSVREPLGQTFFILALIVIGFSSIFGAVNFLATIITLRASGMTWWRLPLFVWATFATAIITLAATPALAGGLFLLLFERLLGTHFFDPAQGGDPLLWQHVFWFYSHPAVYIMILPAFGIISEVIPVFSRKPLFGYRFVALSSIAISALSFSVWAHHMFTSGMASWLRLPFMIMTMSIAVPTGIKFFSWLATMWGGKIRLDVPMMFAVGFIALFLLGGLSGIFNAAVPVDLHVQDTYWVVAHLHFVLVGGSVMGLFAAIYYWFPKMTGHHLNPTLGKLHFWLTFIGSAVTYLPMHWLGLYGMARRVADYDPAFGPLNFAITVGAIILGGSMLPFLFNAVWSWVKGPKAEPNPWHALTLEWLVSSPPPPHNFDGTVPQVVGFPYDYGVPGAQHAVLHQASGGER